PWMSPTWAASSTAEDSCATGCSSGCSSGGSAMTYLSAPERLTASTGADRGDAPVLLVVLPAAGSVDVLLRAEGPTGWDGGALAERGRDRSGPVQAGA